MWQGTMIKKQGWEVSMLKFQDKGGIKFKVTRRFAEMSLSETKIFNSKEEARKQFIDWLE